MPDTGYCFNTASGMDCMQLFSQPQVAPFLRRFNTASGMDCMQSLLLIWGGSSIFCFNTASGMDCMQFDSLSGSGSILKFQYRKRYGLHAIIEEWTARVIIGVGFQYRKRYGLHAMPQSPIRHA